MTHCQKNLARVRPDGHKHDESGRPSSRTLNHPLLAVHFKHLDHPDFFHESFTRYRPL